MVNPFTIIAPFLLPISIAGCMLCSSGLFDVKKYCKNSFTRAIAYLLLTPYLIAFVIATIASFLQILGFVIELFN